MRPLPFPFLLPFMVIVKLRSFYRGTICCFGPLYQCRLRAESRSLYLPVFGIPRCQHSHPPIPFTSSHPQKKYEGLLLSVIAASLKVPKTRISLISHTNFHLNLMALPHHAYQPAAL